MIGRVVWLILIFVFINVVLFGRPDIAAAYGVLLLALAVVSARLDRHDADGGDQA